MERDITTIPYAELAKDYSDCLDDIDVCRRALEMGVTVYSGGDVKARMDRNLEIAGLIDAEMRRRIADGRAK